MTDSAQFSAAATRRPRIVILAAKHLGYNTRVHRQAASLARSGWEVTVAALAPPVAALRAQAPDVRYLTIDMPHPLQALRRRFTRGVQVEDTATGPLTTVATGRARAPSRLQRLVLPWADLITRSLFARACTRALDAQRWDLVQAHDTPALRAARGLARASRAPLVYDGVEAVEGRAVFARGALAAALRRCEARYEAWAIRRCTATVTIGPALGAWMAARYRIPAPLLLRNCREWQAAPSDTRLRETCGLDAAARLVLFANSIVPDAGLEQLVDALPLLAPHVHVAVLGPLRNPSYRDTLVARAAALGVAGRLHFPPPCGPDEVVAVFAGADLGVIPLQNTRQNHFLALPNRLFEMIMARLPVVVSDFPDLAALVRQHDIGLACDAHAPAALARAIDALLEPAAQRACRARLEQAADALCWEREVVPYVTRLRALVAPRA